MRRLSLTVIIGLVLLFSWAFRGVDAQESKGPIINNYPSSYIYGFIESCWMKLEDDKFYSEVFWPDDYRVICACMMDNVRSTILSHDFMNNWNAPFTPQQNVVLSYFVEQCTQQAFCFKKHKNCKTHPEYGSF